MAGSLQPRQREKKKKGEGEGGQESSAQKRQTWPWGHDENNVILSDRPHLESTKQEITGD